MKISVIQSSIEWENAQKNRTDFESKIFSTDSDSNIVLLPEMFTTGFSMNAQLLAENHPGKTVAWMAKLARQKNSAITGSYIAQSDQRYYNRMVFTFPDGAIECYDKRHLFRMSQENENYTRGSNRVVVNYMGWRILLLICYDIRFPVWSRNRNDYDLIILVANFPESRRNAWNSLLVARAIENQCYVAACNRVGFDGHGRSYAGDSQIIDPQGNILKVASQNSEEIISATLSLDNLNKIRKDFPVSMDADQFEIR